MDDSRYGLGSSLKGRYINWCFELEFRGAGRRYWYF